MLLFHSSFSGLDQGLFIGLPFFFNVKVVVVVRVVRGLSEIGIYESDCHNFVLFKILAREFSRF